MLAEVLRQAIEDGLIVDEARIGAYVDATITSLTLIEELSRYVDDESTSRNKQ